MNILDVQDNLKNFSEKQLINEMQMPSGNAPQFLVLSEITRRKRMRDQMNMQKAANEPTVAQEAVASAGVPAQGIMGMSEAMAPKAAMAQGGIGSVMSQPMKTQMPQSTPMPDQGVMAMASGGSTKTKIEERRMKNGKIGLFKGNTFLGTKQESGGLGSLAEKIGFGGKSNVLDSIKGALGFAEGGVIEAQSGAYFPSSSELYGLYGQESGYGKNLFGSAGEIGPYQVLPTTAIMPGNKIKSLFPDLEVAIAKGDYPSAAAAYEANKAMVDEALMSGEKVEPFVLDYLDNAERILGDRDLATLAYNQGIVGTKGFSGDALDTDYVGGVRSNMSGYEEAKPESMASKLLSAVNPISSAEASTVNNNLTMVEEDNRPSDDEIKARVLEAKRKSGLGEFKGTVPNLGGSGVVVQDIDDLSRAAAKNAQTATNQIVTSAEQGASALEVGDRIDDAKASSDKTSIIQAQSKDMQSAELEGEAASNNEEAKKLLDEADKLESVAKNSPPAVKATLEKEVKNKRTQAGQLVTSAQDQSSQASGASAAAESQRSSLVPDEGTIDTEKTTSDTKTEEKTDDAKTAPVVSPIAGAGSESEATSLEAELLKLQGDMSKSREQDKWLSLAQAGLALMSSKEPTLMGALGEAGLSGLGAMKEAESRYQEGVIDLINARAKLKKTTPRLEDKDALKSVTDILSDPLADRTSDDYLEARRVYDIIMARNNYGRVNIPPQAAS
tara:strand:- start:3658 stop:5838 length:2181 start_codon:yes stop_codon:yes gene_type:complete